MKFCSQTVTPLSRRIVMARKKLGRTWTLQLIRVFSLGMFPTMCFIIYHTMVLNIGVDVPKLRGNQERSEEFRRRVKEMEEAGMERARADFAKQLEQLDK